MAKTYTETLKQYKQDLFDSTNDPTCVEAIDLLSQMLKTLGELKPEYVYPIFESIISNLIAHVLKFDAVDEFLDNVKNHLTEFELEKTTDKAKLLFSQTIKPKTKRTRRRN